MKVDLLNVLVNRIHEIDKINEEKDHQKKAELQLKNDTLNIIVRDFIKLYSEEITNGLTKMINNADVIDYINPIDAVKICYSFDTDGIIDFTYKNDDDFEDLILKELECYFAKLYDMSVENINMYLSSDNHTIEIVVEFPRKVIEGRLLEEKI
jgi:hypothetical protein